MNTADQVLSARRALVVGAGISGRAAAELLLSRGIAVRVQDANASAAEGWDRARDCELRLGEAVPSAFDLADIDAIVLSPGVPPAPIRTQTKVHAPDAIVTGEMGLSLAVMRGRLPTALVTGTNGKSTVTALTGHLLRAAGRRPFVGGNLGVPLARAIVDGVLSGARADGQGDDAVDCLVLECSSFQLETIGTPRVDVAMLLNVTPDHLDRYADMHAYAAAKANVFSGLRSGGLALLHARDPWTPRLSPSPPKDGRQGAPSVLWVGGAHPPNSDGEAGVLRLDAHTCVEIEDYALPGRHNRENAAFACLGARHLGADPAGFPAALASFRGLEHRMQPVAEHAGVLFVDDSKATNVASVLAGLSGFGRRFVLIAGGRAKGDDLAPLSELLAREGRGLVAIGESAEAMLSVCPESVPSARARDMQEAVQRAAAMAQAGDAVVLSPACASYDMFRNYAERGRTFADAVRALVSAG